MGVKGKKFKRLLISIPKCIELNSESKPKIIVIWVWVPNRDPDPIYTFFGEKSGYDLPSLISVISIFFEIIVNNLIMPTMNKRNVVQLIFPKKEFFP